jgi:hypothetical protein
VPLDLNSVNGTDSYQFKSKRAQLLSYHTLNTSKRSAIISNKDLRKVKPKISSEISHKKEFNFRRRVSANLEIRPNVGFGIALCRQGT